MYLHRLATAAGLTLCLAGCAGAPTTPPPAEPAPSAGPAAGTAPLALDQRVVPADLAGMQSPGGVKNTTTKEAFVDAQLDPNDPDRAEERAADLQQFADKHFVAGAVKGYGDPAKGRVGSSFVAQFANPAEAQAYEKALYDEEFGDSTTPAAVKGTVAGAQVSHTLTDTMTEDGETMSHAWSSFVDGPFVYQVAAEAEKAPLDSRAVLDAGAALFAKVKGAPAP